MSAMRALILDAERETWLADRRRKGQDVFDEMWEGVLHVVPPPSFGHQSLSTLLSAAFIQALRSRGLLTSTETGVYRADDDYRVPDLLVVRPEHASHRGVERRAELVVEVLSPDDETWEKLPFYADCGVPEVLVVDPTQRTALLHVLRGKEYLAVAPDAEGTVRSALGLAFETVPGPQLRVSWGGGSMDC